MSVYIHTHTLTDSYSYKKTPNDMFTQICDPFDSIYNPDVTVFVYVVQIIV